MRIIEVEAARRRHVLAASLYEHRPEWIDDKLLRAGQVAALFQVSRRTISGWARTGKLESIVTPGGHRRFRAPHVRAVLDSQRTNLLP